MEVVEHIFEERTGFALSALYTNQHTVPEGTGGQSTSTRKKDMLEYLNRILSEESTLIVNCKDGCLSLRCDEVAIDCSAESDKSLSRVIKDIRESGKITTLDLSRRCFQSRMELLEVCKSARMMKRLLLRDVQIFTDNKEAAQAFSLMKSIKVYCPALEEVDTTGCSDATLTSLLESEGSSLQPSGICLRETKVNVVNLLSTNPEVKELLMPTHIPRDRTIVSERKKALVHKDVPANISERIKALVQKDVPANISWDGWSFLHTACAIGDANLVSWLLENGGQCNFQSECCNRPSALDIAISCHNPGIVKLLLHVQKPDCFDPCKIIDLLFSRVTQRERSDPHVDHSSACNPLEVVHLLVELMNPDSMTELLVEILRAIQAMSLSELKEKTCWTEDSIAELLKELVSLGCSPNISIADLDGKTPLMCCASSPVLVKTLLDLGASTHVKDQEGNTALFYAVRKASVEAADKPFQALQILLESKADPNVTNNHGETPLLHVVSDKRLKDGGTVIREEYLKGGTVEIWKQLVESGADVGPRNKNQKTAMHLIIERIKYFLWKRLQNSDEDSNIENVCQIAVNQCIKQVRFISECNNHLVMSRDKLGNTPLHIIAGHASSYHGEMLKIARSLIDIGSKVNARNDNDQTPLHLASSWSMAKFLLVQGARPNPLDSNGCSPLLSRCREASLGIPCSVEPLSKWTDGLNFGMDPWMEDKDGQNVFQILMEKGQFSEVLCFVSACIAKDRNEIFKTDSNRDTLLHSLCKYNHPSVPPLIDLLLQKGADVNSQNKDGDTALHIVCRKITRLPSLKGDHSAYWKFLSPLRAYGAQCYIKNKRGCTVVEVAWFNKKLLRSVRRDPIQREPEPFFQWNSVSEAHRQKLSQVVKQRNCQTVEDFYYHEDPIGSGAFGNVYAAIDARDGREVALKQTKANRLRTRQENREVRSLVQVSGCFQIVKYLGFMRGTGFTWIILELMEGNLDDLLQQRVDTSCFPRLCKDVLLGVTFLHEKNIIHRDLKASNVLYCMAGASLCLKIADFGLSKNISAGISQGSSVYHSNAGSRCWMAPELLSSPGPLQHTFQSDVFACGLIMHYTLANRCHPFERTITADRGSVGYCSAVEHNIKCDTKELSADLTEEALDVLFQALCAERDDRPKASELVDHPFFWPNYKKVQFMKAVANQSEIGTFGRHPPSPVEMDIENNLHPMFAVSPWDTLFPAIYTEMTSSGRGRSYNTSSGVHLVRFIRNAYAHVSESSRPASFQKNLLTDYIFFEKLPKLFMTVYKAVKLGNWDGTRAEIASVINSA